MSTDVEPLECRSYTHARRHPQVIGRISGWTLPSPITPTQLLVLLGSFVFLLKTRPVWAHLGGMLNLIVLVGMPFVLSWCVRHLRMEGRSPIRMFSGAMNYAMRSRTGAYQGKAFRTPRPTTAGGRLFMTAVPASASPVGSEPRRDKTCHTCNGNGVTP